MKSSVQPKCHVAWASSRRKSTGRPPLSARSFAPPQTAAASPSARTAATTRLSPTVHGCAVIVDANRYRSYDGAFMPTVRLKPGHVQPIWMGHPWVYAQAIDRVEGGASDGDEVGVVEPRGKLRG